MNRAPDGGTHRTLRRRPTWDGIDLVEPLHVVERNFDAQIETFGAAGIDDRYGAISRDQFSAFELIEEFGPGLLLWREFGSCFGRRFQTHRAAQKARHLFQGALRGGEPDALQLTSAQMLQPLQGKGEVRT